MQLTRFRFRIKDGGAELTFKSHPSCYLLAISLPKEMLTFKGIPAIFKNNISVFFVGDHKLLSANYSFLNRKVSTIYYSVQTHTRTHTHSEYC